MRATLERRIRTIWKYSTVAEVSGEQACAAEMMVMPG
jgi:3-hydroxymyristoyl/3-hydroxydecanoyl-(acyl carrier protein) dehydratase